MFGTNGNEFYTHFVFFIYLFSGKNLREFPLFKVLANFSKNTNNMQNTTVYITTNKTAPFALVFDLFCLTYKTSKLPYKHDFAGCGRQSPIMKPFSIRKSEIRNLKISLAQPTCFHLRHGCFITPIIYRA